MRFDGARMISTRPTLGLHAADVVPGQLRPEIPWQILVKQNAHGPE